MSDIETFTPLVKEVTIDGTVVHVAPLKARRFAEFQRAFKPVAAAMASKSVQEVVIDAYEHTRTLIVAGTDATAEWLDEQSPDHVVDLLVAVLQVNADFLSRRLVPALERLVAYLSAGAAGGAASSPASGPSDTRSTPPST